MATKAPRAYTAAIAAFETSKEEPIETPRTGTCPECGGVVEAKEQRISNAIRVDGRCTNCNYKLHRAGPVDAGPSKGK